MEVIYFAAFISFVLGASSYIIIRFWVRPIYRYRKRKQAVAATLPIHQKDRTPLMALSATLRKQAGDLSDSFDLELPHWYRMLLDKRSESPVEAARLLMKLANTKNSDHMEKQIDQIMEALKL